MTPTVPVSFACSTGPANGLLLRTDAGHKRGLVVVQEWWGVVPHIEDVAGRFAAEGYTVLVPDLYRGASTVDAEEASHLMGSLDFGGAAAEIAGAVAHLRDQEGCTHVGIVGFCMGGALAVIAASIAPIDAFVSFYGFPPAGAATLANITAPGLFFFGEEEDVFSVEGAQAFVAAQSARGIPTELLVYPGAGHAFFNDTRAAVYVPAAAADAWRRTLAFFAARLAASSSSGALAR